MTTGWHGCKRGHRVAKLGRKGRASNDNGFQAQSPGMVFGRINNGCSSMVRDWRGAHGGCLRFSPSLPAQANNVALHFDTATDTVTGLRHKTIFGRPMWNMEFAAVAAAHPR